MSVYPTFDTLAGFDHSTFSPAKNTGAQHTSSENNGRSSFLKFDNVLKETQASCVSNNSADFLGQSLSIISGEHVVGAKRFDRLGILGSMKPVPESITQVIEKTAPSRFSKSNLGKLPLKDVTIRQWPIKTINAGEAEAKNEASTKGEILPRKNNNKAVFDKDMEHKTEMLKTRYIGEKTNASAVKTKVLHSPQSRSGTLMNLLAARSHSNHIYIAVHSLENGLKLTARLSRLNAPEHVHLRDKMVVLLAEYGFENIDITINNTHERINDGRGKG